jgi:hypothetical protein
MGYCIELFFIDLFDGGAMIKTMDFELKPLALMTDKRCA